MSLGWPTVIVLLAADKIGRRRQTSLLQLSLVFISAMELISRQPANGPNIS